MGYRLMTKEGKPITRVLSHPATDEQVFSQLKKVINDGELDTSQILESSKEFADIKSHVYGDEEIGPVSISWSIGVVDNNTGNPTGDSQSMRLVSNKIYAEQDIKITFLNTAKYKYARYNYDKDGNYIGCDSEWKSVSTISIQRGTYMILKVRENNYAKWTQELINAFSGTVKAEYVPLVSLEKRQTQMEEELSQINSKTSQIERNSIRIDAIESAVDELSRAKANIIVNYNTDFFGDLEYGEISYETGFDTSLSTSSYGRSVGYRYISGTDNYFAVSTASGVLVDFFHYTKDGDSYRFVGKSGWVRDGDVVKAKQGYYYRISVYKEGGVTLSDTTITLTADIVSQIITSVIETSGSGNKLNDDLSNADIYEYNTTAATINDIKKKYPNSAVICFPTDLHLGLGNTPDAAYKSNTYLRTMLKRYNKICELCDIDLTVFGGDYLCNSAQTVKTVAINTLCGLKMMIEQLERNVPIAIVQGNHDDNSMHTDYVNGYVNDIERWNSLLSERYNDIERNVDYLEKGYGYFDIKNRKIRVFILNSCDVPTTLDEENNTLQYPAIQISGFRNEQLNFVADHLYFNESGWQVLFISHHNPSRFMKSTYGGKMMMDIIEAYASNNSGTITNTTKDFESSVTFDYSGNKSNKVIAYISGHTHYDTRNVVNGIQYISLVATSGGLGNYYYSSSKPGRFVNYIVINRTTSEITFIKDGTDEESEYDHDTTIDFVGDWKVSY